MRGLRGSGGMLAIPVALAWLACGSSTEVTDPGELVEVTDPGELVFEMQRFTQGCPEAGTLWSATIRRGANGVHTLAGTWLAATDPGHGTCMPRLPAFACLFEVPFPARVLQRAEVEALHGIIDDFPVLQAEIDGACDPCDAIYYKWNGRTEAPVCSVEPDPVYLAAIGELSTILKELALGH